MLTNDYKDPACDAAKVTTAELEKWPPDIPDRANLIIQSQALEAAIDAAAVPPAGTRYPDVDTPTVLTPSEQLWSDTPEPYGLAATGATATYQDQIRGAGVEPGSYCGGTNAPVRWKNIGGDWFDRDGLAQGKNPWASCVVPAQPKNSTTPLAIDVTEVINAFIGGLPNWGMFLKGRNSNPIDFYSRFATADRPTLTIVQDGTTTVLPCGRSTWLNTSGTAPKAGGVSCRVTSTMDTSLLWFDLAGIGPVDSATLALVAYTGAYSLAGNTIDFYRVSNPAYATPMAPVEYGIAQNYPRYENLLSDPDVLWHQTFLGPTKEWQGSLMGFITESGPTPHKLITDPAQMLLGTYPWLELTLVKGGLQSILYSHIALWRGFGNMKPLLPEPPEELYFSYYVDMSKWAQGPDGGKMPGFNMRYSAITGSYVNAWTPVLVLTIPGMGRGNSGSGVDGFTGSSARGNQDRWVTAGAPLERYHGLAHGDCYHLDQSGPFGTNVIADKNYLAQLGDGPQHVEMYLRMNDVTDPTQHPRRILTMTQTAGVAIVTLEKPETDPKYVTGETWTIGGVGLYSGYQPTQYQGPKVITVHDSTHFTFPCDPRTPATALPGSGPQQPVWMVCAPTQAVRNGVIRQWINGRLSGERTNLAFRHSRYRTDGGIFGIDTAWLVIMEGGGRVPDRDAVIRIAVPTVATKYLGPMIA